MDDNEFWIIVWKMVAISFVVVITTTAGCDSYRARLVRDAISSGVDPIKASCAINGMSVSTAVICAMPSK